MRSFLEGLVDDVRDFEVAQKARSQGSGKVALASEDLRTLARARAETMRVAAMTAGAASIANAFARKPANAAVRYPALPLVPTLSLQMSEQLSRLADTEAFFELYQLWFDAESRLAFARELSGAIGDHSSPADRSQFLHADTVADAWCRACTSIIALFNGLGHTMEIQGVAIVPPKELEVISLLKKAAAGFSPCIESDGSFSLPGWAERRKERRRRLALPIQIGVGIKVFPATLENLSSSGMQIATGFLLPTGSRVAVQLDNGRRLDASVRWSDGTKIGVVLATPLDSNDPLWSAGGATVD